MGLNHDHAMGVMAAYHDIDGVPCAGNPWLMNKVLRNEWGFKGFVLSDLGAIRRLYDTRHVAATPRDAVQLALNSGVDMQFYDFDHATFQNTIIDGINWVTVRGLHLLISTNITINPASGAVFTRLVYPWQSPERNELEPKLE